MPRIDPAISSHLVASLAREARRHPVGRKVLVTPTMGGGRELLRRLALERGGWVGFEVATPRPMALRVAGDAMARRAVRALDAFEQHAFLDDALDAALLGARGVWAELSESVGFRERVHEAVLALRLAGIDAAAVQRARLADTEKRAMLASVLRRYERILIERARLDTAGVLELAASELQNGLDPLALLDADAVLLQPGLGARGLAGKLIGALTSRGARVLETDHPVGREVPQTLLWSRAGAASGHAFVDAPAEIPDAVERPRVSFFHAASATDELREVLRRVVERELRWDQVEIVASDAATYGSALHALSLTLGIPVTFGVGLPVERTRVGRVVHAYLDWVVEGFQAAPIRRLLEAGDLRPARSQAQVPPAVLARRFRRLRIGWGRRRYRSRIRDGLEAVDRIERRRNEAEDTFERRRQRVREELAALRSILFPVLRETPRVPDRATEPGRPVSPAELARGLRAFLRRVPRGRGPERAARDEVLRILERVESTLRRRTHFHGALAILRQHLEVRVRAEIPDADGDADAQGAPWASEGGHLHLTDFEHGGYTGREAIFFVGMDADRVPGHAGQDPLLLDSDRRILGRALPTSGEIFRERAFRLSALFARLRGEVTLSHPAWSSADARAMGPSPFLLQAYRLSRGAPSSTFEALREALGPVVCAVPSADRPCLDEDDAWMGLLGAGPVLLSGVGPVCEAYPDLGAGVAAALRRSSGDPGPDHGVLTPRPDLLDPRRNEELVLSSGRLEGLGSCPLRYLQRTVLGLYPPDDPESEPDRWLGHRERGVLLHRVFERLLRGAKEQGIRTGDDRFESLAAECLDEAATHMMDELPVPGEGTLARELAALRDDVSSFIQMVREHGAPWARLEFGFGFDDDDPVVLEVEGGVLRYRGVVDRVDDAGMDGIRVVDYKTGVPRNFGTSGVFDGGRRLQHALYAHAVESRLGAQVVAGEYHFPTLRGEHEIHGFRRQELASARDLLAHMLDGVAEGRFVPTDNPDDCRLCDFAEICRVRPLRFGKVASPPAEWSGERAGTGVDPTFSHLVAVRSFEE
ncbi:MAG: PD-(D/E)XK nuclease family protein [Gemmatimonadota bacterium]